MGETVAGFNREDRSSTLDTLNSRGLLANENVEQVAGYVWGSGVMVQPGGLHLGIFSTKVSLKDLMVR